MRAKDGVSGAGKRPKSKESEATREVASEAALGETPVEEQALLDVETLVVQNPTMNSASFLSLLKSKGFKITKEAETTSNPLARPKESIREAGVACRFLESVQGVDYKDPRENRFKVILIQEGLGNTVNGYYYTKEALISAVPIFEGKKFYADHPSKTEESDRPERSVRDVYGHFENLEFKEAQDGTGQVVGDVVVLGDEGSDWIRARLIHAVAYQKKFPDKEFVGLSINASGNAEPVNALSFLAEGVIPSARQKLEEAIREGLEEVKIVRTIDSAVSCDLVTEAGAKGKVLSLLEAGVKVEDKDKEKQKEDAGADGEKKDPPAADAEDKSAHSDEEKDKALIMDALKKHGLAKDGEENEESMKSAKAYHEAYKKAGYEGEEAANRACEAMKCAGDVQEAMKVNKGDANMDSGGKNEGTAAKESEIIKLKGENAKLTEKLATHECEKHLDKKLQESKLSMAVTKKFRESLKTPKSVKEIDEKFDLFMEGYRASGEAGLDTFVMTEKETAQDKGALSLDDCVDE